MLTELGASLHTVNVFKMFDLISWSLCSTGHVHLTDFNIAAIVKDDLKATSIAGTKPYMGEKVHLGHDF